MLDVLGEVCAGGSILDGVPDGHRAMDAREALKVLVRPWTCRPPLPSRGADGGGPDRTAEHRGPLEVSTGDAWLGVVVIRGAPRVQVDMVWSARACVQPGSREPWDRPCP